MQSKEALQQLNNFISREKHINSERNKTINECINTIKQDLERLEVLEKENIELQLQLEQLEDSAKIRMQQADEYATILKEKYLDLKQENEKLKKALEIIKNKLELEFNLDEYWKGVHYHLWSENGCEITKQEYELLKEVIINE